MNIRVGNGFDAHRLVENRKLILGGVEIPCERGLLGHSDADVLTHAIMDALLGAAGLGDIGKHFPDTDEKYKGISSIELLTEVRKLIFPYRIGNIDATIIAQEPKLSPYIGEMITIISKAVNSDNINIKATTTEKMGYEGRGEGVSAIASCIIIL